MKHAQHQNGTIKDLVNEDVIGMGDNFSGSGNPARAKHIGMLSDRQNRLLQLLEQRFRCVRVFFSNESNKCVEVPLCFISPLDGEH